MNHSASAVKDRRLPALTKPCLRLISSDGAVVAAPKATPIRYLAVQAATGQWPQTTLFRTWRTADVAVNGCGRCHQCSAVHYSDGLSACGLPHPGPIGDGAEAIDFSPDGL